MKVIIALSDRGKLKELSIVEGTLRERLMEVVEKALKLWNLDSSDLIVMKDKCSVRVKLPLSREEYEEYLKYGLTRVSSTEARVKVPIYVVSFNNEWRGNDYIDNEVYIVAPYINQEEVEVVKDLASSTTATSTSKVA